jgi:predicted kinase
MDTVYLPSDRQMYLMQGVPGSGKSWMAGVLHETLIPHGLVNIRSTDDYRYGDCGHYVHDEAKNHDLHMRTQREVADDMRTGVPFVIVDNTNIKQWQADPYFALAKMYGYQIQIVRVDPGLEVAQKRNATRAIERQVPAFVIERMYNEMERLVP